MLDSQVRVNDVTDRDLQAAFGAVERERFSMNLFLPDAADGASVVP